MGERFLVGGVPLQGDELLHESEARAVLNAGRRALRVLRDDGTLPFRTDPGGKRRYLASDVLALRRERRGET